MHLWSLARFAPLTLAAGLAGPAIAQADASPAVSGFERELWVATGFRSHHTAHASRYNQRNDGLGLEWRWSPQVQFNAGHYRNSVRHGSTYAQVAWTPLDTALPSDFRVRGGASVGVINGYPKVRHGGYFATLVPVMSLEWQRVGINFLYIPSVGKRVDGAYAVQLKLRVS
ncbi:hypothetical protein [Ideonella sp. BN130291]|uniref:hypothetical protein n=1 Tax=Ideonella sp. BN130291 TaxID=3112940 RepID=UPI002E26CCDA|nr:hypothetical protein [Ideonella sp. BN130291]